MWFALSLAAAYGATRVSVRLLDWLTWPMYAVTVAMLVLLLFIGKGAGTAAISKAWLAVGGVRIGQPSELAKITVVLALAKVLSTYKEPPRSLLELWKPALLVLVPAALIIKEPDLGTGIVFVGFTFAMLFWAGLEWRLLLLAASPVVSLVLAFNTHLWGAWFLLLIALVLWYRPYMYEGILILCLNVVFGVLSPIVWEKMHRTSGDASSCSSTRRLIRGWQGITSSSRRSPSVPEGGSARASRTARRSASPSCPNSTRISSSPWSARSWGSSACWPCCRSSSCSFSA
jgi:hypothetical protein